MDFEWRLNGGSKQEITGGYNLCKSSSYNDSNLMLFFNPADITNKTITISLETNVELLGNSIYINSPIDAVHRIVAAISGRANERITSTFTLKDDDYAEIKNLREPRFLIYKDEAGFNEVINPQIVLGDIDKLYEPYTGGTPSPSPEYPSKIENVENDVKMTVYNKNLASWDNKNISFENIISEAIEGNIIKTEGNEGIVNLAYSGGISRIKFSKKLKFGTQYTLSVKIRLLKQGKWSNQTQFFFGNKEKYSSEEQRFELALNTYVLCVFNFKPKLENEDVFTIYLNSNEIEIDLNTLQIEENTAATDYIQHEEQSIIFPLAEGQKLYEGSYLAEDGIHNKRKQIVLTGNENWERDNAFDTTKTILFKTSNNIVNNTNVNKVTFKSNYFIHKRWIDSIYKKLDEPYISQTEITNLYININKDVLASLDVEGLKAWLSEHNVIVEYPLAEEEIIPYTPEQQNVIDKILYTYKNVTNISVDDELATLDITYKKDIETMFNNIIKQISSSTSDTSET